jgi:hypothetical protein
MYHDSFTLAPSIAAVAGNSGPRGSGHTRGLPVGSIPTHHVSINAIHQHTRCRHEENAFTDAGVGVRVPQYQQIRRPHVRHRSARSLCRHGTTGKAGRSHPGRRAEGRDCWSGSVGDVILRPLSAVRGG